ncbi:hypothetical protein PCANC_01757 [Puccinia coronata f. sp. avenae]|uniref:Uncharacterized protein n=1 Tax=Puccinia coronata f. sp. avenae TaxID=200324 RepID=A0A2N5W562_9BASI|nr:hypothetical protein PCANC_01757 [Puccinia coronata f. sp. avenae]
MPFLPLEELVSASNWNCANATLETDVTSVAATDLAAGGCNRYNPFGGVAYFSYTTLRYRYV